MKRLPIYVKGNPDPRIIFKLLANEDLDLFEIDTGGNSPLHIGYLTNSSSILDHYLSLLRIPDNCKQNPKNSFGITHLHIACIYGEVEAVKNFANAKENFKDIIGQHSPLLPGYSCLKLACFSKSLETINVVVKQLRLLYSCLHLDKNMFAWRMTFQKSFMQSLIKYHHDHKRPCLKNQIIMSDLQRACYNGDVDKVESLIARGVNLHEIMSDDAAACPLYNIMHFAIEAAENSERMVKFLMSYNIDIVYKNGYCMTSLHMAMYNHKYRESKCTFTKQDCENDTLTILYNAIRNKVENPMDAFGLTYFHIAVARNDMELVKEIMAKEGKFDYKPISLNLKNFSNYCPLHFAVKYGHVDMAKFLINQGANVNSVETRGYIMSPLQVAIMYGQSKMINLLLAYGADAKVLTFGNQRTTLHLLVERYGDFEDEKTELIGLVGKLFDHDVNINAKDSIGETALHNACWNLVDKLEIYYELLKYGADINVTNQNGNTASDIIWDSVDQLEYKVYFDTFLHIKKLEDIGLEVNENNKNFCELMIKEKDRWSKHKHWKAIELMTNDVVLKRFHQHKLSEIEKLKSDKLNDYASLYDFIKMDSSEASGYIEHERIKEIMTGQKFKDMYKNYGNMIFSVYKKSLRWRRLEILKKNVAKNDSSLNTDDDTEKDSTSQTMQNDSKNIPTVTNKTSMSPPVTKIENNATPVKEKIIENNSSPCSKKDTEINRNAQPKEKDQIKSSDTKKNKSTPVKDIQNNSSQLVQKHVESQSIMKENVNNESKPFIEKQVENNSSPCTKKDIENNTTAKPEEHDKGNSHLDTKKTKLMKAQQNESTPLPEKEVEDKSVPLKSGNKKMGKKSHHVKRIKR